MQLFFYKPPDEVICKHSATAYDHWDCDFKFIIHVNVLNQATGKMWV